MMKLLLAILSVVVFQVPAFACDMPVDDLVPAEQLVEGDESAEAELNELDGNGRPHVVCYARDRYGNMYSASHPHSHKAQEKALRQCERASRHLCWNAGCRRIEPRPHPRPRPRPGHPPHRHPRRGD